MYVFIGQRRETWPLSVWRLEKQPFSLTVSLQVSALLSESEKCFWLI